MATLAPATTRSPRSWARAIALQPLLVPLASLLVAVAVLGAGARLLIVVALPALAIGAVAHRLPRPARAAVALLLGVLALGAGLDGSRAHPPVLEHPRLIDGDGPGAMGISPAQRPRATSWSP
jgi:hypothetical protein